MVNIEDKMNTAFFSFDEFKSIWMRIVTDTLAHQRGKKAFIL